jgi:hypothetical protein
MAGSRKQEINGKSLEYFTVKTIQKYCIQNKIPYKIIKNDDYINARTKCRQLTNIEKRNFYKDAELGVKTIILLEPLFFTKESLLEIKMQEDSKGITGDVRDVVIYDLVTDLEIGISVKNKHEYIKSLRINPNKDFFKTFTGIDSSLNFKQIMSTVSLKLKELNNKPWTECLIEKEELYNIVLKNISDELNIQLNTNENFPRQLTEHILGKKDYYKLRRTNTEVIVEGWNLFGTLNICVNKYTYPERIDSAKVITKKGLSNILEVIFNNGLTLSFRIHNGDTKVKQCGLKLEVKIITYPTEIFKKITKK